MKSKIFQIKSILSSFFLFKPMLMLRQMFWYFKELNKFKKLNRNQNFKNLRLYPCLSDNTEFTPLDPTYFFQDSWAAKKIFDISPSHHYDVGSSAKTMGIISQFVPTTMIDIRPIEFELPNLYFKKGSITSLPFEDNSIDCISSMCVIEHIGLGRYGDSMDSLGSEKAIQEIKRVLKNGGYFLFSVPVDSFNTVYFNAHRAFTKDHITELFSDMKLIEEKYHYGKKMYDNYDAAKGFGTGMFLYKKEK